MNKRTKGFLICALVAASLEAGLLFDADKASNGPNIFTLCVLPFIMLTSAFSGSFGEFAFYLSIFLFFFAVTILGYGVWRQITKDNHDA